MKSSRVPVFDGQYIVHSTAKHITVADFPKDLPDTFTRKSFLSVNFVAIRIMPVESNMELGSEPVLLPDSHQC